MKIIEKPVKESRYHIDMSAHQLKSIIHYYADNVVVANLDSYYNKQALEEGAEPIAHHSVILNASGAKNVTHDWVLGELVAGDDGERARVAEEYKYYCFNSPADRFTFAGGKLSD